MGRKGATTYGKQASVFKSSNSSEKTDKHGETPDPKSQNFYNDEVDQHHIEKDKIPLKNLRRKEASSSDEEVYKIGQDSSDQEEEENLSGDDLEEESVEMDDDMLSDLDDNRDDGNDYLPSADNWGKKKKSFYSTDYVDKDYGGYLSESDEEAAKLEEIEAKNLQKRMTEQMDEADFEIGQFKASAKQPEQKGDTIEAFVNVDVSTLTDTEKLEYLKRQSPEFIGLLEDFKQKFKILENQLRPVVEAIKDGKIPSTNRLNLIQYRFEAYSNYLINVNFYFLLKANQASLKNHPIIDRIIEWKNIVLEIDRKCGKFSEDLEYLTQKLKAKDFDALNELDFTIFDQSATLDDLNASSSNNNIVKRKTKSANTKCGQNANNQEEEVLYDFENADMAEDTAATEEEDGKRAASYQILKNKGTTPKRKKEERNPRVKHRRKFQKALHKKRSQVPDVKRELKKYGGEQRGIKPNVIKSVRLR